MSQQIKITQTLTKGGQLIQPTDFARGAYDGTAPINVVAASTTNVVLSSLTPTSQLDGVTLALGDKVLLKNQSMQETNGVYDITPTGAQMNAEAAQRFIERNVANVVVYAGATNGQTMWGNSTYNTTYSAGLFTPPLQFYALTSGGAGTGTVTNVSVATANGLTGAVATPSTTPVITLGTTVAGIVKGDGTEFSAATAGDFPILNQSTTGSAAYAINMLGGNTNQLVYQTSPSVTGFVAAVPNGVLITDGSGTPAMSATLPAISGAAVTDLNASNVTSGVLASAHLPISSASQLGVVQVDGVTITASPSGLISAANNTYTAGTGLALAGNQFSIASTIAAASNVGSASSVPVLTYNAQGQLTNAVNTPIAIDASQVTTGVAPISRGGTGQITANAALNALLPTQAGNAGKFLSSNGTNASWAVPTTGAVQGGAANTILYQSSANTTAFLSAPTSANSVLSYDGTNLNWSTTPFVNLANNSTVAGTPTTANALVNKAYVDSIANGITVKSPVQAISTSNIPLTGSTPLVVDGVTLANSNSVLLNGQTSSIDNGIYSVAVTGSTYTLTRRADFALGTTQTGASVYIQSGTVYSGTQWINSSSAVVGSGAINFYQSAGAGTYTSGTGLSLSANQFSIAPVIVAASNVGSATAVPSITYNAEGQITATNLVPINIAMSQVSTGVLPIVQGGTGATDANSALNALLPTQTGNNGFVLTTNGSNTTWAAIPAYTAGTGLTLAAGQFSLANTTVTVGSYGTASNVPAITVNARGQITSAVNTPIAISMSQVTSGVLPVGQGGTGSTNANAALNTLLPAQATHSGQYLVTDGVNASWGAGPAYAAGSGLSLVGNQFSIATTGVTAGSYGSASNVSVVDVNNAGQIISATSTPIAINAAQVTSGTLPVSRGGTGATDANTALNTLLPTQAGYGGYSLTTNGTNTAWTAIPTYSAGTGLNLTAGAFGIANSGAIAGSYGNAATIAALSVNAQGQITNVVNTLIAIDASQVTTGALPISRGGTGQTTATGAVNALLPTQAPSAGQFLSTDGSNVAWQTPTVDTVQGGATNEILYQSAADTTAFIAAPTSANSVMSYDGANISWNATPEINLANSSTVSGTPTAANSVVNKAYVDSIANGITVKAPVQALTTTDVALTGSTPLVIDDVTLTDGDSVLLNGEANPVDNGIYAVSITGGAYTLTRRADFADGTTQTGSSVFVDSGTVYDGTQWINSGDGVVGVDPTNFYQAAGVGTYTNGTGLSLNANQFSITPVTTAASNVGDANAVPSITYNEQGQITSSSTVPIDIDMAQVSTGVLPIAQGGTGQTSANDALNALLPAQGSSSGQVLTTDGTNAVWQAVEAYTAGTGLDLTANQFSLSPSGVSAGTFGDATTVPTIGVDTYGRVISATNTPIAINASQVTSGVLPVERGGTGAGALTNNALLIGNGASPVKSMSPVNLGDSPVWDGSNWTPASTYTKFNWSNFVNGSTLSNGEVTSSGRTGFAVYDGNPIYGYKLTTVATGSTGSLWWDIPNINWNAPKVTFKASVLAVNTVTTDTNFIGDGPFMYIGGSTFATNVGTANAGLGVWLQFYKPTKGIRFYAGSSLLNTIPLDNQYNIINSTTILNSSFSAVNWYDFGLTFKKYGTKTILYVTVNDSLIAQFDATAFVSSAGRFCTVGAQCGAATAEQFVRSFTVDYE